MPGYDKQLSFIIFTVTGENFAHSRIFKDHNPNSRTFQGLKFSLANSTTFQDFQGPHVAIMNNDDDNNNTNNNNGDGDDDDVDKHDDNIHNDMYKYFKRNFDIVKF